MDPSSCGAPSHPLIFSKGVQKARGRLRQAVLRHPDLRKRKWRIKLTKKIPQHGKRYDCGLFTCAAALCIMTKRAMNFTMSDMKKFRTQLAHILIIKDSTTKEHTKALQQIKICGKLQERRERQIEATLPHTEPAYHH